jgi:P27 family predicted phage terminase small subunit
MPGPKPTPTHLKLLRGNPGHQKLNRNEPQPQVPAEVPEPPPFVQGHAADEWWRVAPELHALKLLSALDVMLLATYCQAYAHWRTAEEKLREMAARDPVTSGLLVKTASGDAAQNPLVGIARRAAADMVRYASEFGMSPAARARISAGVGFEPPPGKFDGLLG